MPKYPEIQFKHILEANALFRLSFYDAKWKSGVTKKIDWFGQLASSRKVWRPWLPQFDFYQRLLEVSQLTQHESPPTELTVTHPSRWTKILIGPCLMMRSFGFLSLPRPQTPPLWFWANWANPLSLDSFLQIQTQQIKDGRASFNRPLDKDRIPLHESHNGGFPHWVCWGHVYGKGCNWTNGCMRTHSRQPHPLGRPF